MMKKPSHRKANQLAQSYTGRTGKVDSTGQSTCYIRQKTKRQFSHNGKTVGLASAFTLSTVFKN